LGNLLNDQEQKASPIRIDDRDGGLQFGSVKFFPAVTTRFYGQDKTFAFLQLYFEHDPGKPQLVFIARGEDDVWRPIPTELEATAWDPRTGIWNGLIGLDISTATRGENLLLVQVFGQVQDILSHVQVKLQIY
jgi:hypothetical protein